MPDTVEFEADTWINATNDLTNTPRISFETLKGVGKASGTASRFMFMGAHMAVEKIWKRKTKAKSKKKNNNGNFQKMSFF